MKCTSPLRLLTFMVGLAAWSGVVAAECTEGSLDYKPTTHEFKYCDDSETWQPLGGGTALGDRVTSGTLAVTANSATSIISLSTVGTTWGYLGNAVSYLPTISATNVRSRHISSSYVQLTSATTPLTCNAGATGTMRYTSGTMQVCDGSNWGNIGIGVPTGTIAAFEASSCPSGWTEYTPARGRFLRGIDNGAGNDPDGMRAAGDMQGDALQGHRHAHYNTTVGATSGSSGHLHSAGGGNTTQSHENTVRDPIADGTNGTPRTANETRPKNVAVTFCQYAGLQSQLQTGVATLASLSDVSIGGATSGQALVFDGASWVPSATSSVGGFDDLSDVDTSGASAGDVIRFDGSGWVVSTTGETIALGDRVTSGTLAVTANSATSIISLSTGGTTWGYLGSGASYLPAIAAGRVSATNISSTYVQLSSASTVLSCNAGATGTMRYTSGTMQVCDGSRWGNIGIGVPTGTIAAFEASSCPTGWTEYTTARGRFLRGIDNGAGNDPAGTRIAGNTQGDAAPNITGTVKAGNSVGMLRNASGNTTGAFGHSTSTEANQVGYDSIQNGYHLKFDASDSNAKYGAANEIRPKNVAVTFCQYAGFQSQLQTGVATLASLSDVSIGGATSGQALVFDGASWVPSTTLGGTTAASSTGAIQFKAAAGGLGGDGANLFWDDDNDRLGLGTASPSERLDVSGTVQATAYLHASDLRLKSDVETVANPLELIGRLRGVRFTWKEGGASAYGVIAQEVEQVMPEAVAGGAERMKAVDYDQLLGPMIEAIKELRAQNRRMHAEIESLKRKLE